MKTLRNVLVVVSMFAISISLGVYLNMDRHSCSWEDCEHQGKVIIQQTFSSEYGAEEYSDSWCVELTHFMNPGMTYEECEQYVFSGVE